MSPHLRSCCKRHISLPLDRRTLVALWRRLGGRGGGRRAVSTGAHRVARDSLARSIFHCTAPFASVNPRSDRPLRHKRPAPQRVPSIYSSGAGTGVLHVVPACGDLGETVARQPRAPHLFPYHPVLSPSLGQCARSVVSVGLASPGAIFLLYLPAFGLAGAAGAETLIITRREQP